MSCVGNPRYIKACAGFWSRVAELQPCDGLLCTWLRADSMRMMCEPNQEFGFGASADSAYE